MLRFIKGTIFRGVNCFMSYFLPLDNFAPTKTPVTAFSCADFFDSSFKTTRCVYEKICHAVCGFPDQLCVNDIFV